MSASRRAQLARERERLVADAVAQRAVVALRWQGLATPLRQVDRGLRAWQWLRARPLVWALPALALLVWRPRWLPGLLRNALGAVRLLRGWP